MLAALAAAVVAPGQTFVCTPIRVWDGDGPVWCAEGPRVRLAGIAAREMDGACRGGQPCPPVRAEDARDALVGIVGRQIGRTREGHIMVTGPALRCRSTGSAGGNRTAAWCMTPAGEDVSCAMLRTGTVAYWPRYDPDRRLKPCRASPPVRKGVR